MQNNFAEYLHYRGEKESPIWLEEDYNCNRHMWWHYESAYFHSEDYQKQFPLLADYIKDVLNNKVDYGDLDGKLFKQYIASSPYRK